MQHCDTEITTGDKQNKERPAFRILESFLLETVTNLVCEGQLGLCHVHILKLLVPFQLRRMKRLTV